MSKKPTRREERKPKQNKPRKVKAKPEFYNHPIYGKIPRITIRHLRSNGQFYEYKSYDPDFRPEMPKEAVPGNISRQNLSWGLFPKYFYVDEEKECKQCGKQFVFTAKEQKYWYENLRFTFYSHPIRCAKCRHQRRNMRALNSQISEAVQALAQNPHNVSAMLSDAEATVRLHRLNRNGNLDRAIAKCRQAYRHMPEALEALFWEAAAQLEANRPQRATPLLEQFLAESKQIKRLAPLRKQAESMLSIA